MRITTSHIAPPIPTKTHDWSAIDDETYSGDESDPVGYGSTEIEAIRDLLDQIEANKDEQNNSAAMCMANKSLCMLQRFLRFGFFCAVRAPCFCFALFVRHGS